MPTSKQAMFPDKTYVAIAQRDNSGSEIDATTQIASLSISGFGRDTGSGDDWLRSLPDR